MLMNFSIIRKFPLFAFDSGTCAEPSGKTPHSPMEINISGEQLTELGALLLK